MQQKDHLYPVNLSILGTQDLRGNSEVASMLSAVCCSAMQLRIEVLLYVDAGGKGDMGQAKPHIGLVLHSCEERSIPKCVSCMEQTKSLL